MMFLILALSATASLLTRVAHAELEGEECGTKVVKGMEITCLIGPPLKGQDAGLMMAREMEHMQAMGKRMDQAHMKMMREAIEKATHQIGFVIHEAETGKKVPSLMVSLTASGPGKPIQIHLMEMGGSYGGPIRLTEKGKYQFKLRIKPQAGSPIEVTFDYEVR